jgi:predicted peptidase
MFPVNEHILSATTLAEVFPDGQKITAAILEFDRVIDNGKLSPTLFSVKGRTVIKVYANTESNLAEQGENGKYVIIELSLNDAEADVLPKPSGPRPGAPKPPEVPPGNFPRIPLRVRKPLQLSVKQLGDIAAADGTILPACNDEIVSIKAIQPVVDEFRQYEFKDIRYSLFTPKDYNASKQYPLVMFIGDASTNSDDPFVSLAQGIGGVIWATPQEQAKHPCFVLVPQIPYGTQMTRDDYTASPQLETIKELLDDIVHRYSVDTDRIYITGQSQGCMVACELNVRYPDFFAASLLVSGQWNPETMAATLTKKKLFIALSEGGPKEFPGMNAVAAALEAAGAHVARACLNARNSKEQLNADVNALVATNANILYAIYDEKTVLPDDGKEYPRIAHHHRGWEITYDIEAVRDWLFSQTKRQTS